MSRLSGRAIPNWLNCSRHPLPSSAGIRRRLVESLLACCSIEYETAVPVGNLIRLVREAESRNVSVS
jgi:hypothetical protein